MIDKFTYDQLEEIIKDMKTQEKIIKDLLVGRSAPDISDFVEKVDVYNKFLENTIELNKDADKAIADLMEKK